MEKRDNLREAQRRVLDDDARQRRLRKALELLEQDNQVDEPQTDCKATKKPRFGEDDGPFGLGKSKKKRRSIIGRSKFKKTFESLLEEEYQTTKGNNYGSSYFTATVPPSRLPPRKFCSVCGFLAPYVCVVCGVRFCSIRCRDVHKDTRCLKWVS